MLIFQPHIDDSGSEPDSPVFILAGFIASATQWAAFSDEWQAVLDLPPKLDYFKMKEAARMKDQFDSKRGWTEAKRDDRLIAFTRIINKYARVRIHASMKNEDFAKYVKHLPVPERKHVTDNPYFMIFLRLVLAVAVFGDQIAALNEPCDYVCDEQTGIAEEIVAWWPEFKRLVSEVTKHGWRSDLPKFIGSTPIFRDEKDVKPLQAADMYAWQLRKNYVLSHNKAKLLIPASLVLRLLDRIPQIGWNFGTDEMVRMHQHLLGTKKNFEKLNPGVPLVGFSTDKRERKKARREARKKKPNGVSSSSEKPE